MILYALNKVYAAIYLEKVENATTEERSAALDQFGNEELPDIVTRGSGSESATIDIIGPLSPEGPSPIARFFGFGGASYKEIVAAADTLKNDASIKKVTLRMNTPGGTVEMMDQARQALVALGKSKELVAENHGQIASAGYYLAAAAGKIIAFSPLVETGSIGIIRAGFDNTEALARNGVRRIKIVSSNAPNKNADPSTAQGLKVHQDEVDAAERVFIRKIAEGRGTTDQKVIDNFGKGGMLIAEDPDQDKPDALKAGMIDAVITTDPAVTIDEPGESNDNASNSVNNESDNTLEPAAESGEQHKGIVMDLVKLKADHPALYAEAVAIGVKKGTADERERVEAHVTMGEASGDMAMATKNITDGVEHTAATNAKYMAAGWNKKAVGDRGSESEADLKTAEDEAKAATDALATATAQALGVDIDE
jgi:ClpP class serine protease